MWQPFLAGVGVSFMTACAISTLWLIAETRRERAAKIDLPHAMLVRRRSRR